MLRRSLCLLALLLFAAVSLAAQEEGGGIGYLAVFKVKPGKEADFINLVKKYDEPLFDKLMAEGAVGAWGVDTRIIHEEKGPTHLFWWATANWAGMDKVLAAFAEQEKKNKAEEEQAAAEARRRGRPVPPSVQQQFLDIIDVEQHHDHLTRSIIFKHGEGPPPADILPYTWYSFQKLEPGKSDEWRKLFEKYTKPVLDELVGEGAILAYGVDVEEVHTEEPSWRLIWAAVPNLASIDKVRAAFRADNQRRSAEEREAIDRAFEKVTDSEKHRDMLFRSVIFKVAAPSAGQ